MCMTKIISGLINTLKFKNLYVQDFGHEDVWVMATRANSCLNGWLLDLMLTSRLKSGKLTSS